MTAHVASQPSPEPASAAITPLLRTVLLCDLVESTALVERLGDSRVAQLLQRHDQLLVRLLSEHNGQLIDKSDGVLALFERPIQALAFAMDYQRGLRELGLSAGETLQARIGIHVGDVMTWTHTPAEVLAGAKPVEVEGLAKPVAARLMGLALPGQILLSGMAQNFAHRAQAELGERAGRLHWRFHGRYRFKGVPAPMLVHEAGETGLAPLKPPPSGAKAWREVPFWRKPPVLAIEALLLVGLASFGIYSTFRSPPAIAFAERDWVVVADFNNRTGETLYDDALDSALRVGLEQSRYVNMLSDLQVEQALQRMQRTAQALDRQTGSELALREGAKALVLPTIAEVGGRPRVSVEVVDPNSGVTVYTRMADASGSGGVVAALDDVITEMRADLGESLTSIQKNNVPLEKATTENLEALRAFSLGVRARSEGRISEGIALFQQAIALDSDFAMAYLRLAFAYLYEDNQSAERYFKLAENRRERLSQRESLLLDASSAIFEKPEKMVAKWKLLASIYPDEYRAHYSYAYFMRHDLQKYEDALKGIEPAFAQRNAGQGSAVYLQGTVMLALDRLDDALAAFKRAEDIGVGGYVIDYANAYAARRDYKSALAVLSKHGSEGASGRLFEEFLPDIVYPLDQGDMKSAQARSQALVVQFQESPPSQRDAAALVALALRSYGGHGEIFPELESFIQVQDDLLKSGNKLDSRRIVFFLMSAAWLAAHEGNEKLAQLALSAAEPSAQTAGFPANSDMAMAVRAELKLHANDSLAAIDMLQARSGEPDSSFFIRAVLRRAYAANGDREKALALAKQLSERRGLAYGEFNSGWVWQPVNVIESNLAAAYVKEHSMQSNGQTTKEGLNNSLIVSDNTATNRG